MDTIGATSTVIARANSAAPFDEAQLAAAAFLARYSGRTLDAYRHDLRSFFQWATDTGLEVLAATRPHIEMYRAAMERRGLAPSTIDRRLSTVCGYYRFAHIDGHIPANPAQYVRRPKVQPREGHGMDRGELGTSCSPPSASTTPTPPSRCCSASMGYGSLKRARPTPRISGSSAVTERCGSSARATSRRRFRSCRARPERSTSPSVSDTTVRSCDAATANDSIVAPHIAGCARSANELGSKVCILTCCAPGSSWRLSTPVSRFVTCRSPPATPIRGRPRSTTGDARTSTGTLPTSLSPSSPETDQTVPAWHFGDVQSDSQSGVMRRSDSALWRPTSPGIERAVLLWMPGVSVNRVLSPACRPREPSAMVRPVRRRRDRPGACADAAPRLRTESLLGYHEPSPNPRTGKKRLRELGNPFQATKKRPLRTWSRHEAVRREVPEADGVSAARRRDRRTASSVSPFLGRRASATGRTSGRRRASPATQALPQYAYEVLASSQVPRSARGSTAALQVGNRGCCNQRHSVGSSPGGPCPSLTTLREGLPMVVRGLSSGYG